MLYTNLNHIEKASDHHQIINQYENVMICCGRMGTMCIPVYRIMEEIQQDYKHIKFFDMEFDNPESQVIRNLTEVKGFTGIPFTIYYKNGNVVKATSGIQTKEQIISILEQEFRKLNTVNSEQ